MNMNSRFLPVILIAIVLLSGCGSDYNGQLLGAKDRPDWRPELPYGMVYVPSGQFHIGPSDQDVNRAFTARAKSVSIQGFFMDDTEITNNEYRQFVYWVRDSLAHSILGNFEESELGEGEGIDWSVELDWSDPETREQVESLFIPRSEPLGGGYDPEQLTFKWYWVDLKTAANDPEVDRGDLVMEELTEVYPDTLTWVRDFSYSYNEPLARRYFSHPAFDDYPVVGVTWDQARAFCAWRTKFWNDYKREQGMSMMDNFRLPIEHEWEYAARGGKDLAPYPWGGPYVRNSKGCLLANFKPGRGNYPEDGGMHTVRADAYWPNDYGLYNMAGNVAEWTSSAYYENSYSFIHDINPDIRYDAAEAEPATMKRKVIRGGSWKDIAYYLQTGSRHWEYETEAKSYIGFRCVSSYLGRDYRDGQ